MDTVYYTAPEAANYVGLSASYLAKLRMKSGRLTGPKYLRIGSRAIRYCRKDLDAWMQSKHSGNTGSFEEII